MKICTNKEIKEFRTGITEIRDLFLPKCFTRYLIAEDVEVEVISGDKHYLNCKVKKTNFLLSLNLEGGVLVLEELYFKDSLKKILSTVGSDNLKALYINGLITLAEWERLES